MGNKNFKIRWNKNILFWIIWILTVTLINTILVLAVPKRSNSAIILCAIVIGYPSFILIKCLFKKIN